jgi:hypothetical protein
MYKYEIMSRYILNEIETSHHLIWSYFILTILITEDDHNHILVFVSQLQLNWVFFIPYNKITNVRTVPAFNRKIVEICKFDIPNTHIHDPSWLSSSTSIKSDGVKLLNSRFF